MNVDPRTPLGLLCVLRPEAIPLLRGMGIPLEQHHATPLSDACAACGLDPELVLAHLGPGRSQSAARTERDPLHELQRLRPRIGTTPAPWENDTSEA